MEVCGWGLCLFPDTWRKDDSKIPEKEWRVSQGLPAFRLPVRKEDTWVPIS